MVHLKLVQTRAHGLYQAIQGMLETHTIRLSCDIRDIARTNSDVTQGVNLALVDIHILD